MRSLRGCLSAISDVLILVLVEVGFCVCMIDEDDVKNIKVLILVLVEVGFCDNPIKL